MKRAIILAAAAGMIVAGCSVKKQEGGGTSAAGPSSLPSDFKLTSASITLPDDSGELYPAGPGLEAMNANCRSCHSPSMVLNQPPLSHEAWAKIVEKMREVYKAPMEDSAEPAILAYLDNLSAKEGGVRKAAAPASAAAGSAAPKTRGSK